MVNKEGKINLQPKNISKRMNGLFVQPNEIYTFINLIRAQKFYANIRIFDLDVRVSILQTIVCENNNNTSSEQQILYYKNKLSGFHFEFLYKQ